MRRTYGRSAALVAAAIFVSAIVGAGEPPQVDEPAGNASAKTEAAADESAIANSMDSAIDERLLKTLATKVDVAFAERPLDEVIEDLGRQAGIEIRIDQRALREAGVATNAKVSLSLKRQVTLESALGHLCRKLRVHWHIEDDLPTITHADHPNVRLTKRVYPVADLVTRRDALGRETVDTESLMAIVTSCCAPSTWEQVGGSGSIAAFGSLLIVCQTPETHLVIVDILERLRRVRRQQDAGDFSPVAVGRSMEREDEFSRMLGKRITMKCDAMPLAEFVERLGDASGIDVVLDQRAFADNPFFENATVTGEVTDQPIRAALPTLLKSAEAAWFIRDEAIFISSNDRTRCVVVTYLYPVGDFVAIVDDGPPKGGTTQEALVDLVTKSVAPNTWDAVGGTGEVRYFANCKLLAITQTPDVHSQIADLLAAVRRVRRQQASAAGAEKNADDSVELRVYRVGATHAAAAVASAPTAAEIVAVVRDLVEPQSWTEDDVYLRALGDRIVVGHRRSVQARVKRLIGELSSPEGIGAHDASDARTLSILAANQFDLALKDAVSGARYGGEIGSSPLGQRVRGDYRRLLTWNVMNADEDLMFSLTLSSQPSDEANSMVVLDGSKYFIAVTPYASEIVDLGVPGLDRLDTPLSGLGYLSIREVLADLAQCAVDAGNLLLDRDSASRGNGATSPARWKTM
ncbi:MAG: DUF4974 domain-containing protein [Pirellulales bacterium]